MGRRSRDRLQRKNAAPSSRGQERPAQRAAEATAPAAAHRDPAVLAAAVALLLVLVTAWAAPRVGNDTFMALAGGRDVAEGRLGKPDDWSYTTAGRVWLNQNWGFDVLAYACMKAAGETGVLALKGALLVAIAAAIAATGRARGATWPAALLATAAAVAGCRHLMEIRANTASYLLASLLLLIIYRSRTRPRLLWLAVPLMAVWANVHGGFMLGLALLGLWAAASAVAGFRAGGARESLRRTRLPAGALAAALALAALANPFGVRNVTYPFTYAGSPEWRGVTEWHPLAFRALPGSPSAWEFLGYLAAVALPALWHAVRSRPPSRSRHAGDGGALDLATLDAGMFVAMAVIGFSALRFVAFSFVLLAPLAALGLSRVLSRFEGWLPAAAVAALLAAAILPFSLRVLAIYSGANPRFTRESTFQRMIAADQLPVAAATFLADNGVAGRVFAEWTWESYLRWRRPELRLFIGGRATQIYSLEVLREYGSFGRSPDPSAFLERWDTHLAVVPLEHDYLRIVDRLAFAPGAHWALIFYDGTSAVLADRNDAAARGLADAVESGRARFGDGRVAALSRALARVSGGSGDVDASRLGDLVTATRALPTSGGPWFVLFAARAARTQPAWLVRTLEDLFGSFAAEGTPHADGLARVRAGLSTAQILANLYGRGPRATQWIETRERLLHELEELLDNP